MDRQQIVNAIVVLGVLIGGLCLVASTAGDRPGVEYSG